MTVVQFKSADDRMADQMFDDLAAVVHGRPTSVCISVFLDMLAFLIAAYGRDHGDTAGLANRVSRRLIEVVDEADKGSAA